MLHHVPTPALQDRLLQEVHRVLRAGGLFAGTDATDSPELRKLHVDDVFVPVDADTFGDRLVGAGFEDVVVERERDRLRFVARKPGA
jgi:SAM-dependent methyltransferase